MVKYIVLETIDSILDFAVKVIGLALALADNLALDFSALGDVDALPGLVNSLHVFVRA